MKIYGFLKNVSRAQPDNIFLQHAAIKSIGMILLAELGKLHYESNILHITT